MKWYETYFILYDGFFMFEFLALFALSLRTCILLLIELNLSLPAKMIFCGTDFGPRSLNL